MTAVLRAVLTEFPAWSVDQVIVEAQKRGVTQGVGSIRSNIYNLKSRLKVEKEKAAKPTPAPAPKPAPTQMSEHDELEKEATGLPPKDSPHRAEAELTLRKEIVEFVFKKGLAGVKELLDGCGLSPRICVEFMTHEWFERHTDGRWRLSKAGKEQVEM